MSFAKENPVDDCLIDRLVDGELEEMERQRLLALLETEPGGWRRCALAFLEAQAWTRTLSTASKNGSIDFGCNELQTHALMNSGRPENLLRQRRTPVGRRLSNAGILAAGILLAFAAGWIASGARRPIGPATVPFPTGGVAEVLAPSSGLKMAFDPGQESPDPPELEQSEPSFAPQLEELTRQAEAPPVLTESVRRELERQGYHVQQRSGLVSLELENGQSLEVPVDEVELRYVGNRIY
ncbi:hypothetical protein V5E97_18290 [Singulisphaera sp. Ch08]|uniref:Uncharacterized protein n=1 Tax=Singulisphaera sp. Ch08 TaxID=3120278 RepID=A0AAU7CS48_9BACT